MKKEILLLLILISFSFGAYNYLQITENNEEIKLVKENNNA